jgi:hypothetical protein
VVVTGTVVVVVGGGAVVVVVVAGALVVVVVAGALVVVVVAGALVVVVVAGALVVVVVAGAMVVVVVASVVVVVGAVVGVARTGVVATLAEVSVVGGPEASNPSPPSAPEDSIATRPEKGMVAAGDSGTSGLSAVCAVGFGESSWLPMARAVPPMMNMAMTIANTVAIRVLKLFLRVVPERIVT